MLLGVEHAPALVERGRSIGADQAFDRGSTVGDVDAGDLVIAVVLVAFHAGELGVGSRLVVTGLREDADRILGRVVGSDVDEEQRVEGVALAVQLVAGVFGDQQLIAVEERQVVKAGMRGVTLEDNRDAAGISRRLLLGQAHDAAEPTVFKASFGLDVGVAGDREIELLEAGSGTELTVFRALERRTASGLGRRIGVERRRAVLVGVVDGGPAGREFVVVAVKYLLDGREDVVVGLAVVEDDRLGVLIENLQDLELATLAQIVGGLRHKTIDEGIGLLGILGRAAALAAIVFDQPDAAVGVDLHALIGGASEDAREVGDLGREIGGGRPDATIGAGFGGEQQHFGKRVPGGTVDQRQRLAVDSGVGHQGDAMLEVGIEINAGQRAIGNAVLVHRTVFVALEQEVGAVVDALGGASGPLKHEIGVLVRLGLGRLDRLALRRDCALGGRQRAVGAVAVIADHLGGVFEREAAFSDRLFDQSRRQHVVGRRDRDGGQNQRIGERRRGECDQRGGRQQEKFHVLPLEKLPNGGVDMSLVLRTYDSQGVGDRAGVGFSVTCVAIGVPARSSIRGSGWSWGLSSRRSAMCERPLDPGHQSGP